MLYLYGSLNSRRLGLSLGITLTPSKTCNFDCIYCQLGKTKDWAISRREYIPIRQVMLELRLWLENNPQEAGRLNYITISGSGEPVLNEKIGELVREIKELTGVPVAILTNSALLSEAGVRQELLGADLIVPSLDAATQEVFEKIDRPLKGIKISRIIEGLIALRGEFGGKIWLEVMLVKGVNDDLRHIGKLKEAIDKINPDKIQLNSPVRATSEPGILAVPKSKLNKIKEILGDKCQIL